MYTLVQEGDASVVRVYHDLDFHSSASLGQAIRLAANGSRLRVVVSLESCSYCDARAVSTILRAKVDLQDRLVVIVPERSHVRRIFELLELVGVLNLRSDLASALVATQ